MCKKLSQGRRLDGAGALGDFSDNPAARSTGDFVAWFKSG
jgi:hypothetical protein